MSRRSELAALLAVLRAAYPGATLVPETSSVYDDIEGMMSQILSLPNTWVICLICGFDGDTIDTCPTPTYPSAFRLGRRLWRRHGKKQIRR